MADITGRDDLVIAKALYLAIHYIDKLPVEKQPLSDQDDMQRILTERYSGYEDMFIATDMGRR
jgi:hypothetical protein